MTVTSKPHEVTRMIYLGPFRPMYTLRVDRIPALEEATALVGLASELINIDVRPLREWGMSLEGILEARFITDRPTDDEDILAAEKGEESFFAYVQRIFIGFWGDQAEAIIRHFYNSRIAELLLIRQLSNGLLYK